MGDDLTTVNNQNNTGLNDTTANDQSTVVTTTVSDQANSNTNTQTEVTDWKVEAEKYKKLYSDSSTEGKKLAQQVKDMSFYSQVGAGLVEKLQDPTYREAFEKLTPKQQQAVVDKSVAAEQTGTTQTTQPQQTFRDPYALQKQMEEQQQQYKVWELVEGDDAAEIDKYNQTRFDPVTRMPVIDPTTGTPVVDNPIRSQMGATARALQAQGVPFDEAARRAKLGWKVAQNPDLLTDPKQEWARGMIEGLESRSMQTMNPSKGFNGQRQKQVHLDDEQVKIFEQLGLDPNDPARLKRLAANGGI